MSNSGLTNVSNFSRHGSPTNKCYFLEIVIFDKENHGLYLTTIITAIINGVMAAFATFGNTLFIVTLFKTRSLQTPSNLLLGNLALSDLLVGLIIQPLYVAYKSGELNGRYSCGVHVSFITLAWIAVGVSFLTLSTISLERSISIFKSFLYPSLVQEKTAFSVSAFIWILTIVIVISRFLGLSSLYFYVICLIIILTSFITTIIIYVKIYRVARQHQISIRDQTQTSIQNVKHFIQETKLATTVGLITGLFFLSYLPTLAIMAYYSVKGYSTLVKTVYSWTDTIVFFNSSLNPLVYYLRNQHIRQAVLRLLMLPNPSRDPVRQIPIS